MLSFGFCIPVVLFADAVALIGMLMILKTCAYVWTVLIGFKEALIKSGAQIAQQIFRQIVQIERRWADAHQAKFVRYAGLAQNET